MSLAHDREIFLAGLSPDQADEACRVFGVPRSERRTRRHTARNALVGKVADHHHHGKSRRAAAMLIARDLARVAELARKPEGSTDPRRALLLDILKLCNGRALSFGSVERILHDQDYETE